MEDDLVCKICGKRFNKLITHVIYKHGMTGAEYREEFGYKRTHKFISPEEKERARQCVLANYDRVVVQNLHEKGASTRCTSTHKPKLGKKHREETLQWQRKRGDNNGRN